MGRSVQSETFLWRVYEYWDGGRRPQSDPFRRQRGALRQQPCHDASPGYVWNRIRVYPVFIAGRQLRTNLLPIGNDQAVELFYNFAVTPWFNVAPDLQVVLPAREETLPPNRESIDTALVLGVRAKINF